jgi:hypothetical protein
MTALPTKALKEIWDEASKPMSPGVKDGLAYRHMVALTQAYINWAHEEKVSIEQSVMLLAWANKMHKLAEEVGPEWNPPETERLSLLQFIARTLLGEKTS